MAQSYATLEDLDVSGIPLKAFGGLDKTLMQKALLRASSYADFYLRDAYTLPLAPPFDPALVDAVCAIAAWRLMARRGFNPDDGNDKVIRQLWLDAVDWLKQLSNGKGKIDVVQSTPESLQPNVSSNTPRGYGELTGGGGTNEPIVPGFSNWGS